MMARRKFAQLRSSVELQNKKNKLIVNLIKTWELLEENAEQYSTKRNAQIQITRISMKDRLMTQTKIT